MTLPPVITYLNGVTTEDVINFQKGAIENNNNFEICVTAQSSNLRSCSSGYDGPGKKPEYVTVNLYGDFGQQQLPQSQAQSSSNSNENNNALSQSQETTIIICNDGKCSQQ